MDGANSDPRRLAALAGRFGADLRFFSSGTPDPDTLDSACGVPVDEYFWLNSLHPTYPVHDVVAEQVAAALAKGPNVC